MREKMLSIKDAFQKQFYKPWNSLGQADEKKGSNKKYKNMMRTKEKST